MTAVLTKSIYISGLQCVKKMWLNKHRPELGRSAGGFREMTVERGRQVGELARREFPDGRLISAAETESSVGETTAAIREGASVLFEAAFLWQDLFCRVDVLYKTETGAWDLVEVKSTLDVQDLQLPDAAFQKYVLLHAGIPLGETQIMHLNRSCRHPHLENLFIREGIDDLLKEELSVVPAAAAAFRDISAGTEEPETGIGDHCLKPRECGFIPYCWRHVPSPSVFNIPRLDRNRRARLLEADILSPFDIPGDFPLSKGERSSVDLYKGGRPKVNKPAIRKRLESLRFPLQFLDFETDNPPVPRYPGTGPYQQVPFQYSLHLLHEGGELVHREYLHTGTGDPRPPLAKKLAEDLQCGNGTIIAYFATFEKQVIKSLLSIYPRGTGVFEAALERFWDLLDIFKHYYRDPAFLGSNSLKSVLPVLVPHLDYAGLEVGNGTEAQAAWNSLIDTETDAAEKARLQKALLTYCRQDTLAMVEIYQQLKKAVY